MDVRLDLLQEYRRKRVFPWRPLGFGFLLGVLTTGAVVMFFFRPGWFPGSLGGQGGQGPDAPTVTVSPGGQARRRADAVIRAESAGRLGGEVALGHPRPPAQVGPSAAGTDSPGVGQAGPAGIPPAASAGDQTIPACCPGCPGYPGCPGCPGGLHPGDVASIPVSGVIHTVYTDARTGRPAGEGDHPVTGVATVGVTEDYRLRVDTQFTDSVEIAIDVPERHWFIGGFAAAGFDGLDSGLEAGAFVEYRTTLVEFPRLGAAVVAGAVAEVFRGGDGLGARAAVRVGVAF